MIVKILKYKQAKGVYLLIWLAFDELVTFICNHFG